ncbi:MAG: FAD-dependent oxidoreductase [Bacteroidales bacterium]|nr:FAD-dependent oxidoreductase [Bacteroidales bacterium]
MGVKTIAIKLPTNYHNELIENKIRKELRISDFTYHIVNKSLDARNKRNIHWQTRIEVYSKQLKTGEPVQIDKLEIPYKKTNKHILVTGSGPAGFFAAFVLLKAGYKVTLIERGSDVDKRDKAIKKFENTSQFDPQNNYSFGEGGAGTFSDGKLTSRSKHISKEKQFILQSYIDAGAPGEIAYMTHPHLGTDNLKLIVKNLRQSFENLGGKYLFETQLNDINVKSGKIISAETSNGTIEADAFFIATGHSAFETYRMLMKNNITFRTKNFAIGCRMEHFQETINLAQWGCKSLPGVKAAEYRLTSKIGDKQGVYSFCMCPGGVVVPATAYPECNIVNGMSYYQRDGKFANAACVAGIHPNELWNKEVSPLEALDLLQSLEESFYSFSNGYVAPICSINDFIKGNLQKKSFETSYPLGTNAAELWKMLPSVISNNLKKGLQDFTRKLKGFENGHLIGLESKTSSPIQVIRDKSGLCEGFENLYIIGEGSGYAGGIISSAADGVRAAMSLVLAD